MLKCKTCGQVFPGIYVEEGIDNNAKSAITLKNPEHICARGHLNDYTTEDYMDFS